MSLQPKAASAQAKEADPVPEASAETDYELRFGGIGRLYGVPAMETLAAARVAVIGIGGVGSWTAEGLARSGVGQLDLIDLDDVCQTNTNRQIHALTTTVGELKVEAMQRRIQAINPECRVNAVPDFFTASSCRDLITSDLDYVVDAIDNFRNKCLLITLCRELDVPLVVCGGAGGRRNPAGISVADLARTSGDRLLHRVRKQLRQKHGFPRGGRKFGIPTVFSDEPPMFPKADGGVCERPEDGTSLVLDCQSGYGTASFVTGVFGLMAAGVVVSDLAAR